MVPLCIQFILSVVHSLWLMALAAPSCGGPSRALLACRPAQWLGLVSYALYCNHLPVLNWCTWAIEARGVSRDAVPMRRANFLDGWHCFPAWAIAPLLAVCLAFEAGAYWRLEAPARKAINGTGTSPRAAPAEAQQQVEA